MLNIFIDAQIPSTQTQDSPLVPSSQSMFQPEFHTPTISQPTPPEFQPVSTPSHAIFQGGGDSISLRRAVFAVALRQELFTSFMKQRSLHFQLSQYESFRDLSPAQDAVWAHRAVVFCADVFEYSTGAGADPRSITSITAASSTGTGYSNTNDNSAWPSRLHSIQFTLALQTLVAAKYFPKRGISIHTIALEQHMWSLLGFSSRSSTILDLDWARGQCPVIEN